MNMPNKKRGFLFEFWGDFIFLVTAAIMFMYFPPEQENPKVAFFLFMVNILFLFIALSCLLLAKKMTFRYWIHVLYFFMLSFTLIAYVSPMYSWSHYQDFKNYDFFSIAFNIMMCTIIILNSFRFHRWWKRRKDERSEKALDEVAADTPKVENMEPSLPKPAEVNKKRVWCNVVVGVLGILALFIAWGIYKTCFMSGVNSRDVEDYISGRYMSFAGGQEIRGCIPAYDELDDYESLSFAYFDGRRKSNLFHKYYTLFALCVHYSEEEYLVKKAQTDITHHWPGGSSAKYKFVAGSSLSHVIYGVQCIDDSNTIEYVAICGDNRDTINVDAVNEGWFFSELYQWNSIF